MAGCRRVVARLRAASPVVAIAVADAFAASLRLRSKIANRPCATKTQLRMARAGELHPFTHACERATSTDARTACSAAHRHCGDEGGQDAVQHRRVRRALSGRVEGNAAAHVPPRERVPACMRVIRIAHARAAHRVGARRDGNEWRIVRLGPQQAGPRPRRVSRRASCRAAAARSPLPARRAPDRTARPPTRTANPRSVRACRAAARRASATPR